MISAFEHPTLAEPYELSVSTTSAFHSTPFIAPVRFVGIP